MALIKNHGVRNLALPSPGEIPTSGAWGQVSIVTSSHQPQLSVSNFLKENQTATPITHRDPFLPDEEKLFGKCFVETKFPEEKSQPDDISGMRHSHSPQTFPALSLESIPVSHQLWIVSASPRNPFLMGMSDIRPK